MIHSKDIKQIFLIIVIVTIKKFVILIDFFFLLFSNRILCLYLIHWCPL